MKIKKLKNLFQCSLVFFFVFNFLFSNCVNKNSKNSNLSIFSLLISQSNQYPNKSNQPLYKSFADLVKDAPGSNGEGFKNSTLAINGVRGGGKNAGSTDVYSLGTTPSTGYLVLEWSNRKVINGEGVDFVVYENPFLYANNPNSVFMEQVIVEVSIDGISYCGFNPQYVYSNPNVYSMNPQDWVNFAGKNPVLFHEETNRLPEEQLFNLELAGGDGFDLSNLSADNSFGIGCSPTLRDEILNNGFLYIRLVNAFTRNNPNTASPFLKDAGSFDGAPDIDGVAAKYLFAR
ncbi:MAG: LIC_13355 family lipoprotein [Leptospiraceae bacterium]|nr:LIC_13355 family lipoprotein [Leptospiraceae bacterium]